MTETQASAEHRLLIELCLGHLIPFYWTGPGLLLISRQGADAVLADLDKRGARILGLEGFELVGDEIRPRLDLIFDADRLPGFPSPQDAMALWPDNVWIDITLDSIQTSGVRLECPGPL
jgi:hypothetical protein